MQGPDATRWEDSGEREPDWQALRARAERVDMLERAATALSPSIAPVPPTGFVAAAQFGAAPSWDATDLDETSVRRSTWRPKLLAALAVVALGVGGVAFSEYRTAEAEREVRTEKLLADMRQADVQRAAAEAARDEAGKQAAIAAEQARTALKAQATSSEGDKVSAASAQGLRTGNQGAPRIKAGKLTKARPMAKGRLAARPATRRGKGRAADPRIITYSESPTGNARDPLFGL